MIKKLNQWYDGLQEPIRFLMTMALIMAGIVPLSLGYRPLQFAAAIYLGILFFVRVKGEIQCHNSK